MGLGPARTQKTIRRERNDFPVRCPGEVAVAIEGFEVKALDQADGMMSQEQMQRSLYELQWIESEVRQAIWSDRPQVSDG